MSITTQTQTVSDVSALSLEAQIGQMMGVGFAGLTPPDYLLDWIKAGRVGTVVLFARNIESPQQVATLTASLQEAAPHPLLICVDQEGGIVARLREGFTETPGNMALGATGNLNHARQIAELMATEMRAVGINWNLAPVADVNTNPKNPVIGLRSFGDDPNQVSAFVRAQVEGYQAANVAACVKHFPGHGNTTVDSHLNLPVIDSDLATLSKNDFPPFLAAIQAGVASVMAAHIHFPFLVHDKIPATFSREILLDLLRGQMGFDGVITTDCMEMRAIADHYSAGEAAVRAARAGVNIMFFSHTPERQAAAYESVLKAAQNGSLDPARVADSVARVLKLKTQFTQQDNQPPLAVVGSEAHQQAAYLAARDSITALRTAPDIFPIESLQDQRTLLVEFASYQESGAVERGGVTGFSEKLKAQLPALEMLVFSAKPDEKAVQQAADHAANADIIMVASRNAFWHPTQAKVIKTLGTLDVPRLLFCLRSPNDAALFPDFGTVLLSFGDSPASLQAMTDAILGKFTIAGHLPI